jgi:hypothetical protein
LVSALTADGNTNYDAAVNLVRLDAFDDTGALTGPGVQNVSYFLSDGDPNPNVSGLDGGETTTWQTFINGAEIVSYAIGLGTGVSSAALNPVAYDGRGTGADTNAIVVTNLSQLNDTLLGTVAAPVSGNLVSGGMSGLGADGGYVSSVTIAGQIFTYVKGSDVIGHTGPNPSPVSPAFDGGSNELTLTFGGGEKIVVNMDTGSYVYTPPTDIAADATREFGFTLTDGDGDTSSNTLTINLDDIPPPPTPAVVSISNGTSSFALADAGSVLVDAATEGNYVYFQLSLDKADAAAITVKLSTQDNDTGGGVGGDNGGTDGDDFNTVLEYFDGTNWQTATDGNVTFLAGQTEVIVRVATSITGNDQNEPEAFRANIDSVVSGNVTISTVDNAPNGGTGNTGEGQIDAALSVSVANASDVTEGNSLQFNVSLNAMSTTAVVLNLAVAGTGGTAATAGSDFQTSYFYSTNNGANWIPAIGNQATIPAGQTSILVRVDTINDAADELDNEQLTLTVTVASVNAVISDGTGTGHIDDNDLPPNAAPLISNLKTSTVFEEDGGPIVIDSNVTVSDSDSANFANGTLTVTITNAKPFDVLAVQNQGTGNSDIGVNGSDVTYNPPGIFTPLVTIATFTGGTNGQPLVITFNSNATPAIVERVVEAITFENTSDSPDETPRQVTFVVSDGDGGASNPATTTISVEAVDDPAVAVEDRIRVNIAASNGAQFLLPVWALLHNDSDPDTALTVLHAQRGSNDLATANITENPGFVTVRNNGDNDWGANIEYMNNPYYAQTASITTDTGPMDGGSNDDILLNAANTATTLNGNGGNDVLIGGSNTDQLNGGAGHDLLVGGGGIDILVGGDGNDILIGGGGRDTLTGGAGDDVFVVDKSTLDGIDLPDLITDFEAGIGGDVIDLTGLFDTQGGGLDAFVRLDGTGGFLQVDADGATGGENFKNVVEFQAPLPANSTIAILFTNSATGPSDDSGTV